MSGRNLTLIDTPGFFDTEKSEEVLKPEIMKCITECSPGPHAFLIVLKVEKFTMHEQGVIDKICEYFSDDALNYAVLVFTHGDNLEGMTIEEFVGKNEKLRDLMKRCGGRCHVFDNKHWNNDQIGDYRNNQFQLKLLLHTIDKMGMETNGSYYTNEVLQHVEERILRYEEQIRETSVNMSPGEVKKKAKAIVSDELLVRLAGTATGVVLGAFFGVMSLIDIVMKFVKSPSDIKKLCNNLKSFAPTAIAAGGEVTGIVTAVVGCVTVAAAAVTGGVIGGAIGSDAAIDAKTPLEAVKRASEAVKERKKTMTQKQLF